MKHSVAPKKPLPVLWDWIESDIAPDVIVLTEARVPKEGLPKGWTAIWPPGGIGPRRTWGTIIASCNLNLRPAEFERNAVNDSDYGSEGWRFKSVRARQCLQVLPRNSSLQKL